MPLDVEVRWKEIGSDDDPMWDWNRVLYAYVRRRTIFYIGKAGGKGSTVRKRFHADDKGVLHEDLEREHNVKGVRTIVGDLHYDGNFSDEMLYDVETLLIHHVQPWGNIQATQTRIVRPGLKVVCKGADWIHPVRTFYDGH
jgi:hypothetical protein